MSREIYEYKGNRYCVENATAFKHPETREWIDALIYYSLKDGRRWVREINEFKRLFTKVEE